MDDPGIVFSGLGVAMMGRQALRHADQIVLAHLMVAEESNEILAAPELIEALGVTDCLFTLDAEHCQRNF